MSSAAIIVAAGSSQRMGFDKLAADLCGRPVLAHAVAAFCDAPSVKEIIVVCPEERFQRLLGVAFSKPLRRVDGGATRQESVRNGLLALSDEISVVAVHDGARPLVTPVAIETCLEMARRHGASSLARRVTETLKRASVHGISQESIERDHLWFMETPQCFAKVDLLRAYEHVHEHRLTVTDEVSAMEAIGIATHLMESMAPNLKITIPADLALAAYWMDAAAQTR